MPLQHCLSVCSLENAVVCIPLNTKDFIVAPHSYYILSMHVQLVRVTEGFAQSQQSLICRRQADTGQIRCQHVLQRQLVAGPSRCSSVKRVCKGSAVNASFRDFRNLSRTLDCCSKVGADKANRFQVDCQNKNSIDIAAVVSRCLDSCTAPHACDSLPPQLIK